MVFYFVSLYLNKTILDRKNSYKYNILLYCHWYLHFDNFMEKLLTNV